MNEEEIKLKDRQRLIDLLNTFDVCYKIYDNCIHCAGDDLSVAHNFKGNKKGEQIGFVTIWEFNEEGEFLSMENHGEFAK